MERQEPTLGAPADLADLEFRSRRPHRAPPPKPAMGLEWKIAIGVFLGLMLFGLTTCVSMAIFGHAVQQEQERQAQAIADELKRKLADPDPMGWKAAAQAHERERRLQEIRQEREEAAYYALRPGERCIGGKRFRRVDNGWVQEKRPCR